MRSLISLIRRFAGKRVMVVGDLCLDEYIIGRAERLSREAPVPILQFQSSFTLPGAAANPALNVNALQGRALMVGVVGKDEAGRDLLRKLKEKGIDSTGVMIDPSRATTVKTRVMAEVSLHFPQQIVRVDRQERREPPPEVRRGMLAYLEAKMPEVDAVLLSDYRSGVIDQGVVDLVSEVAGTQGKILTADSQGDLFKFKGFTILKANKEEAEMAVRRELVTEEDFAEAGRQLLGELMARAVLITRGSDGMSLVQPGGGYLQLPAANRSEVFDVTGAGDTVIATLTLALAAGASVPQAVQLSNYAAGLVVRKLGNATPTPEELVQAVRGR